MASEHASHQANPRVVRECRREANERDRAEMLWLQSQQWEARAERNVTRSWFREEEVSRSEQCFAHWDTWTQSHKVILWEKTVCLREISWIRCSDVRSCTEDSFVQVVGPEDCVSWIRSAPEVTRRNLRTWKIRTEFEVFDGIRSHIKPGSRYTDILEQTEVLTQDVIALQVMKPQLVSQHAVSCWLVRTPWSNARKVDLHSEA